MPVIETKITIVENKADGLFVRFGLTNTSAIDVVVLKRYTPLEGLKSDCLIVLLDGNRVRYDGYLVKRTVPFPSSYILVRSKETVSNVIDISEAYDVAKPGNYEVKFNERQLVVVSPAPTDISLFAGEKMKIDAMSVDSQSVAVTRDHAEPGKETIGQRMRDIDTVFKTKGLAQATLIDAKVVGGTPEQKKIISKAHKKGYRYAKKALQGFNNDNRYRKWFGDFTEVRAEKVQTVFQKIITRMERTQFSYHVRHQDCAEDEFAWTTEGGYVIWLCVLFWEAPDEGFESRAGTCVHEHSHASGKTDDHEYSNEGCLQLAKDKPNTAIKNADSFEYYAESHFM